MKSDAKQLIAHYPIHLFTNKKTGRNLKHRYRNIFWLIAFCLLFFGKMSAQQFPQIDKIQLFAENDSLRCRYAISDLFAGNTRQTLLSGLPVLVQLRWQLLDENDRTITQIIQKFQLKYDIWEDQFFEESPNGKSQFASIGALENAWLSPEPQLILAGNLPDADSKLRISLDVNVILLSRTQGQQLKNWIFNANETEESLPGANRDTGFTLDLNRLFSLFFSRSDVIEQVSARKMSPDFTLNELRR